MQSETKQSTRRKKRESSKNKPHFKLSFQKLHDKMLKWRMLLLSHNRRVYVCFYNVYTVPWSLKCSHIYAFCCVTPRKRQTQFGFEWILFEKQQDAECKSMHRHLNKLEMVVGSGSDCVCALRLTYSFRLDFMDFSPTILHSVVDLRMAKCSWEATCIWS